MFTSLVMSLSRYTDKELKSWSSTLVGMTVNYSFKHSASFFENLVFISKSQLSNFRVKLCIFLENRYLHMTEARSRCREPGIL